MIFVAFIARLKRHTNDFYYISLLKIFSIKINHYIRNMLLQTVLKESLIKNISYIFENNKNEKIHFIKYFFLKFLVLFSNSQFPHININLRFVINLLIKLF